MSFYTRNSRGVQQVRPRGVEYNADLPSNRFCPQLDISARELQHSREPRAVNSYEPLAKMNVMNMGSEVESDFEMPEEDHYNIVDSPEERKHVRILPARPPRNADEDYADRRVVSCDGSLSPQSSSPVSGILRNIPPRPPNRTIPGPSVNRNLKPTRLLQPPTGIVVNPLLPPRPARTLLKEHQPLPPETRIRTSQTETTQDKPWRPMYIMTKSTSGTHKYRFQKPKSPIMFPPRINSPQQLKRTEVPSSRRPVTPPRQSQDLEFRQGWATSSSTAATGRGSSVSGITAHKSRYVHEWPQTRNDIQKLKPADLQKPKITSSSTAQGFTRHSWYIGTYDRCDAEAALYRKSVDGAFLVRDSSKKIADEPYVLVVFYGNKVYNVKIRYLLESQQYALGTGLWGNAKFDSISDIIKFYKTFPIILIDGKDQSGTQKEQCILTYPVTENDIKHLWFFNPC
ncbi:cytokine-dependent hematopoietic cell linker isoform X1 [Huso huso]|uniref:Cytokine-dependent hematopoietic cell linker isoform X1 n=1 Tax=Huso huso TaxID=61971 RepID=A0ABR1A924_HUSHU